MLEGNHRIKQVIFTRLQLGTSIFIIYAARNKYKFGKAALSFAIVGRFFCAKLCKTPPYNKNSIILGDKNNPRQYILEGWVLKVQNLTRRHNSQNKDKETNATVLLPVV